jgi:hypothetical protein
VLVVGGFVFVFVGLWLVVGWFCCWVVGCGLVGVFVCLGGFGFGLVGWWLCWCFGCGVVLFGWVVVWVGCFVFGFVWGVCVWWGDLGGCLGVGVVGVGLVFGCCFGGV